jgi:hypothetical protein
MVVCNMIVDNYNLKYYLAYVWLPTTIKELRTILDDIILNAGGVHGKREGHV